MDPKKIDLVQKVATVAVLVILLLVIRGFEDRLFYDPFLEYFRNDYLVGPLPKYDSSELLFGLSARYFLNTIISIGIIYVLFTDSKLVKFTAILYLIFYIILVSGFFALLEFQSQNHFLIFYARRFLIQPLFLLLFVPAFFYQKRMTKK